MAYIVASSNVISVKKVENDFKKFSHTDFNIRNSYHKNYYFTLVLQSINLQDKLFTGLILFLFFNLL